MAEPDQWVKYASLNLMDNPNLPTKGEVNPNAKTDNLGTVRAYANL